MLKTGAWLMADPRTEPWAPAPVATSHGFVDNVARRNAGENELYSLATMLDPGVTSDAGATNFTTIMSLAPKLPRVGVSTRGLLPETG